MMFLKRRKKWIDVWCAVTLIRRWCGNQIGSTFRALPYHEGCKHIILAANVCGYTPVNIGKIIKDGVLADIESIHRMTIDRAVEKKQMKEELRE